MGQRSMTPLELNTVVFGLSISVNVAMSPTVEMRTKSLLKHVGMSKAAECPAIMGKRNFDDLEKKKLSLLRFA